MVSNKSRLLRLYRYLYLNTDSEHYTTKNEIMDALRDGDTVYSRQTVRDDIDTLTREGYDIETVVSSGNYYYFRDREFTPEELRMISDAVASSRFIGRKQKAQIRRKLKNFCSRYQAEALDRHLISVEPARKTDRSVLDKAEVLYDAIRRGHRVGFQLWEEETSEDELPGEPGMAGEAGKTKKNDVRTPLSPAADPVPGPAAGPDTGQTESPVREKRAVLAAGGAEFICTPLDLIWDGKAYYLVGLEDPAGTPVLYALERLVRPVSLEQEALQRPGGFRSEQFAREALGL